MAIIQILGRGETVDFSVNGTVVSVGDVTVDASEYQADMEVCVDICRDADGFCVGTREGACYVMSIVIPPSSYYEVPNGEDSDGNPVTQLVAAPLDPACIQLNLWPYFR